MGLGGYSGYSHAPVSLALAASVGAASALAAAGVDAGPALGALALHSLTEVVLGGSLLHGLRGAERRRGSARFLSAAGPAAAAALLLTSAASRLLAVPFASPAAYTVLFAALPMAWADAPHGVDLGWGASDAHLGRAAALALALCRGARRGGGALPAACGALCGGLLQLRFPSTGGAVPALERAVGRLLRLGAAALGRLRGRRQPPPPPLPPQQQQQQRQPQAAGPLRQRLAGAVDAGAAAAAATGAPLDPGALDALVSLGFSPDVAAGALRAAGGDVAVAADLLLSQG